VFVCLLSMMELLLCVVWFDIDELLCLGEATTVKKR